MAGFARFELPDGTPVLFETATDDLVRQYGGDAAEPTDGGVLAEKLAEVAATADTVSRTLRRRLGPQELTVEMGLKVSGRANWFVASAATEGNIKVTLKWTAPRPDPAPGTTTGTAPDTPADRRNAL